MAKYVNTIQNIGSSSERRVEQERRVIRLFMVFQNKKIEWPNPIHIGYTRDISLNGVYFYTSTSVSAGEDVALTVYIPALPDGELPPRLESKGEVVRVEQIQERGFDLFYGVAVKFDEQVRMLV